VVQNKECGAVGKNLVSCSCQYLRIFGAAQLCIVGVAIYRVVTFDVVDIKEEVLENKREANQPRDYKYGDG